MKRIKSMIIICLTITIFMAGFATAATITVRADSWPPYNDEPNSEHPGYMIEIAEAIFAAHGHDIDYQLMPWARSLDAVQKGTYDAVVGTDPAESPELIFPNEPFGVNQNGFFVKKGSAWKYSGIESIKQIRLGVVDGYGYYEDLDTYIEDYKGNKLFAATGDDALSKLLKMLKAGRLDVVIENVNVMTQVLKDVNLSGEIVNAGNAKEKADLFMAFTPEKESSEAYSRIFDEGIVKLRSSGKLQEILTGYGLADWK